MAAALLDPLGGEPFAGIGGMDRVLLAGDDKISVGDFVITNSRRWPCRCRRR